MTQTLARSWPLFLGMLLLMVGNGVQGTLLGVRGAIEGFSTLQMSFVMSAYFLGFLGGSHLAPEMIRRVGHVRVFAALASLVSAVLILYPVVLNPWAWTVMRVLIGFCFCGVYVTAESWLNASSTNETRGAALSVYMVVQMIGIVMAQGLLLLAEPTGFILFVIPSVLVSISFAPILLAATPVPAFETTKAMGFIDLFKVSPLGCAGIFLMGGVYSALFGMASVYATQAGLSVREISIFIASIYLGGLIFQFPVGWVSDRIDRRVLIVALSVIGSLAAVLALAPSSFALLLAAGFLIGGMANPLYGLLIAHTSDYLEAEELPAASGRMLFLNGVGAVIGPIGTGALMTGVGPAGFFIVLVAILAVLAAYGAYRMTVRPTPDSDGSSGFAAVMPSASSESLALAAEFDSSETAEPAATADGALEDEDEDHEAYEDYPKGEGH
ncbi:MAG: MFS transporter [Mangrovicoccus sp.]